MKKLIVATFALLLLAGCGSSAKKETKTCTQDMGSYIMIAKMDAEDDVITVIDMKMNMENSAIPYDVTTLTDAQKEMLESTLLSSAGFDADAKGITASLEFNDDGVVINAKIDINKADEATLKNINYTKGIKLSDTVKIATESGATCE